jgi:hypothetical protein
MIYLCKSKPYTLKIHVISGLYTEVCATGILMMVGYVVGEKEHGMWGVEKVKMIERSKVMVLVSLVLINS